MSQNSFLSLLANIESGAFSSAKNTLADASSNAFSMTQIIQGLGSVESAFVAATASACSVDSDFKPCLESIFLDLIDLAGASAQTMEPSPFLYAWWSDNLIIELLDQGFDPSPRIVIDGRESGLISLCARACSGKTFERLLRAGADGRQEGSGLQDPVFVACANLNTDALRHLFGWLYDVPDQVTFEELTRGGISQVSLYPETLGRFKELVALLIKNRVPVQAAIGLPSALSTAFELDVPAVLHVLLEAGCDPTHVEPSLNMSVESAIEQLDAGRMVEVLHAWRTRAERSDAGQPSNPPKTFESVMHDPLTVRVQSRRLN